MKEYNCNRCGYITTHKGHFKTHLNKTRTCPPIKSSIQRSVILNELYMTSHAQTVSTLCPQLTKLSNLNDSNDGNVHKCDMCEKTFKSSSSRYRHQRKFCNKNKEQSETVEKNKDEKIEELTTQVHGLLQMLMETSTNKSDIIANDHNTNNNQTNITNNTNNNTNNNITQNNQLQINNQINNYGKEDTSYITKEMYKEILKNPFSSLSKLINEIHFNDEHPENKNMQIPNKKQPFVEFYDDGWVIGNQYKFVCKLFFVKKELLHKAYLEVEDMLDEKTKEAYRHFREETTLNPRTVESQLKDIQAAIMSGTRRRKEYLLKSQTTNTTTIINAIET